MVSSWVAIRIIDVGSILVIAVEGVRYPFE
jgi:hypothetical protein